MFNTDQPINKLDQDLLGRKTFAIALGDAILKYGEKASVVIGLYGEWGSGKTSIMNMAMAHIAGKHCDAHSKGLSEKDYNPVIVRFNPWNYSDQNQLIAQFFKQLSVALRMRDYASGLAKAGELIETYSSAFTFLPVIGSFATSVKSIGGIAKNFGEHRTNDLSAIKEKINELIGKQSHKVIVTIDDIDRLNDNEIRQIFQLVKSLGDFHNMVYLLAFDKKNVIKALDKVQEGSGEKYLEKIVQIPFEVPLISQSQVQDYLIKQLNESLGEPPEIRYNENYWSEVYDTGLKHFFKNIRDVNRYINSLRFSFGLLKDEVNWVDLMAIVSIQVFLPDVYQEIKGSRDILTEEEIKHRPPRNTFTNTDNNQDEDVEEKQCNEIINAVDDINYRQVLKDLLIAIFPKVESIYRKTLITNRGDYSSWRREGRIRSPDIFSTYFIFDIPEGEFS